MINKTVCDFVSVDWHTSIEHARKMIDDEIGIQGNMDPRIFYQDYDEIEDYLNSLSTFGSQNQNWIFNLGYGFLPDIEHKKVKFVVNWIKDKDWNRYEIWTE